MALAALKLALSKAERIRQVTYSRAGLSWLVISGFYKRSAGDDTDLIFYAKFMISEDHRSFSAFEASYPISEKLQFDPIIERMEESLTPPGELQHQSAPSDHLKRR